MTPPDSSPIHSFPPKLSLRETLVKVLLIFIKKKKRTYGKEYEQLLKVKIRTIIKNYYFIL